MQCHTDVVRPCDSTWSLCDSYCNLLYFNKKPVMKVDIKAFLKYGIVVEFLYILFVGTCYLQNSKYFCYCSQDKDNVALILFMFLTLIYPS